MKAKAISTAIPVHTCILVGVINKTQDQEQANEYLDELAFLAMTYGLPTKNRFTQRLEKPDKATFIGKGKLQEIKNYVKEHQIDVVIFDDELSPSQQRNLEKELGKKILDRTTLISPNTSTFCRDSPACGPTLNVNEAAPEHVAEQERKKLRRIDALFVTKLPCLRSVCGRLTNRWPPSVKTGGS